MAKKKAKLNDSVMKSFATGVRSAIGGRRTIAHYSELAEHFIEEAGGPRRMARMLFDEWEASKPGSIARVRIMQVISSVWRYATETTSSTADDLGLVSEEDLERLINEKVGLIVAKAADAPPGTAEVPTTTEVTGADEEVHAEEAQP